MKMKLRVLGARSFNDTVEGTKHDFTKLNVEMEMPSKPNMFGCDRVEMQWGDHSNFDRLKASGVELPAELELDVSMTTKGYEVNDVTLVAKPQAVRPAAAG